LFVIEDVQTMGGRNNAVQTQGSLMHSKGVIETVAAIGRYPTAFVLPRLGSDPFGLAGDKAACLAKARELYPAAPLHLAKHHNRGEALLIARYGLDVLA
jgi:hypothetical protein